MMTLAQEFARSILLGDTLEDKFAPAPVLELAPDSLHSATQVSGLVSKFEAPLFPGRPGRLSQVGKAEFPGSLRLDSERGRVLHFFANHELLAMELMALALLKFPEAPSEFRASLVRTIQEEQSHLRLYLTRMRELGVDFGDLPVSDYFWKSMREVPSPLVFVTQMSLTLEQANLDFSIYYRDAARKTGDEATALILDQVYREEIGHVKNGLAWFEKWRRERGHPGKTEPFCNTHGESTWDAYRRILPPPMTASRAKGRGFTVEGRLAAGLSEDFIRELRLESSSKGRPPMLRWYESEAERQIAHSLLAPSGFTPTATAQRVALDLEPLLTFVSGRHDLLRVRELPSLEWRESCALLGYELPEYVLWNTPLRERKLAGIAPWAWSEGAWQYARPLQARLTPASGGNAIYCEGLLAQAAYPLAEVFSKAWSKNHEGPASDPLGRVYRHGEELHAELAPRLASGKKFAAKALYGASGTQVQRLDSPTDLEGPRGGWLIGLIRDQGGVWIEPWVQIEAELSVQFEVRPDRVEVLGVRQFETGPRREFRGTWLDPQLRGLGAERLAFLHSGPLEQLIQTARIAGERLRAGGYQGPAGIDAYLWRSETDELRFQVFSELNPRYTMGRVALELEKRIKPGATARWRWIFRRELLQTATQEAPRAEGTHSKDDGKGDSKHSGTTAGAGVFEAFARELASRHPHEFTGEPGSSSPSDRSGHSGHSDHSGHSNHSGHADHLGRGLLKKGIFFTNDPATAREILTYLEVT